MVLLKKIKKVLLFVVIFLPNPLKKFIYKHLLGWTIGKGVSIGLSYIEAENVVLMDNVKIGHFNIIKGLKFFHLGVNSKVNNFNRFNGINKDWDNTFKAGNYCGITSFHVFDSGGGIYIGDNVTVGGYSTQIWTHEISLQQGKIIPKPVHIGSNTYIASSALLAPGSTIPSNSVVGLGAVVPGKLKCDDFSVIVGNPAIAKKKEFTVVKKLNSQ